MTKRFGKVLAVDNVSLTVESGKLTTLLGPSGCGKTTTLRCVAGLERPDAGEIYFDEKLLGGKDCFVPTEKREIGMVFQTYAIWPHMTVYQNIAFGLKIRKIPKNEIQARTNQVIQLVGLEGIADRYASLLSGGQQQRVAVARSIVYAPKVLLFDEPLSNLDAKLRERMRIELRDLQRKLGITSIYVTHDQIEAMAMSDSIALMNAGRIVQLSSPKELYEKPKNIFVAEFVGKTNFLNGKVVKKGPPDQLGIVQTSDSLCWQCPIPLDIEEQSEVVLGIRSEGITLCEKKSALNQNSHLCKVIRSVYLGNMLDISVEVGADTLLRVATYECALKEGQKAFIYVDPRKIHCFPRPVDDK